MADTTLASFPWDLKKTGVLVGRTQVSHEEQHTQHLTQGWVKERPESESDCKQMPYHICITWLPLYNKHMQIHPTSAYVRQI